MDALTTILKRIEQKKEDYAVYGFEKLEMAALNTFFDLAQEYDSLENLYMVSVSVPRVFFWASKQSVSDRPQNRSHHARGKQSPRPEQFRE